MLVDAIRGALLAVGRSVLDADVAATPTVGVLVRQHRAAGAIQVSASHNPPEYNGIKLFTQTGQVLSADEGQIEQVLVNLIENAIKFSKRRNCIDISVHQDGDTVTVGIKDFGQGIDDAYVDTIFEKFSTGPTGSGGQTEGTGLGLAICKAIIEAHNGCIWVDSRKGLYSVFYFSLPKSQAAG